VETFARPSHGENRGSSPLGSASKIKHLALRDKFGSKIGPISRRLSPGVPTTLVGDLAAAETGRVHGNSYSP
jgi:hypothetical protein